MECSTTAASAAATITPESIVWSRSPISSSSVNVMAAIGALKAAAMPAAIPTDVMRRQFCGLSRAALAIRLLTPAQIWTVGPSRPSDAPEPIWKAQSTNLPMVSRRDTSPERSAKATFTWGMPEPAAAGTQYVSPRPTINPPTPGVRIVKQDPPVPGRMIGAIDEQRFKPADGKMECDRRQSAQPPGKDRDGQQTLPFVGHAAGKPRKRVAKTDFATSFLRSTLGGPR